jgi:hypothetical protein
MKRRQLVPAEIGSSEIERDVAESGRDDELEDEQLSDESTWIDCRNMIRVYRNDFYFKN